MNRLGLLYILIFLFTFYACKQQDIIYNVLTKEIKSNKDTIHLKNKFPFKWDMMIVSSNKKLIDKALGFNYKFIEEPNDIEGMPPIGKSIIFLKDNKIIYHEDVIYKYQGFDIVGGKFKFEFIQDNGQNLYKISSDSAIYSIKKELVNGKENIILYPYGINYVVPN